MKNSMIVDRKFRLMAGILAFAWTVMGGALIAGATDRSADEVSRITRQVSEAIESPYCPGQSLAMCPSANAAHTRQDIQQMAEEGRTADEIKEVLVERYGDGYELIEPPFSEQMTLLGGLIGGLAIAVGVVGFLARRRLSDDDGDDSPGGIGGDDDNDSNNRQHDDEELYLEELRAEVRD